MRLAVAHHGARLFRLPERPELAMDFLYSLYDALVSINVPNDKARAVVDAMERDMGTTLATKLDLQFLRQELRQEMSGLATRAEVAELRQDVALLRHDMESLAAGVSKDLGVQSAAFRKDLDVLAASFRKDLELLSTAMTVRLGSMLAIVSGLLFAALKLT
jgi:hypothetical protein